VELLRAGQIWRVAHRAGSSSGTGTDTRACLVEADPSAEADISQGDEKTAEAVEDQVTAAAQSSVPSDVAVIDIDIVEDVIYLEVPKDATVVEEGSTLEAALMAQGHLPEGYRLLPQDLLAIEPSPSSKAEDENAQGMPTSCVFVAFKRAPSSASTQKLTSLGMFSFAKDVERTMLPEYLASQPGKSLKIVPSSLGASMGGEILSGLLIGTAQSEEEWIDMEEVDEGDVAEGKQEVDAFGHGGASSPFGEEKDGMGEDDNKSKAQSRGSARGGEEKDEEGEEDADDLEDEAASPYDQEEDEAVLLERLLAKVEELTAEKDSLTTANADLQRKAVVLIAREKALLQGQSRAGTAPEEGVPGKEDEPQKEEHVQEKEKQFSEILVHIVDARKKASQQQLEYDQLALDLQTRLDDRNFKAGEIYESFKAFKKEILTKAENSRTSKPMSKRLIKQFEAAELQREEDLERVRLRNISMRTQLKKMEKTLRAREQLAEGLYMIDFEQLKVENQTLYEKIEERSEELVKLKRKKTITVQMLTHVREKLRFIENVSRSRLSFVLCMGFSPYAAQQTPHTHLHPRPHPSLSFSG